jgi:hypothetical protein
VNRSTGIALATLALLALACPSARAQQVDVRAINFGIGGGLSIPVSAARHAYRNGFNGSAFVRFDFGKLPLALRADFSYQNFELQAGQVPALGLPGGGTGTLLGGLGSAQLYLRRGAVRPYVMAGAGVYSVRTEFDAQALATRSDTRLGLRGGAGVLLTYGSLGLYAEGGLDHLMPPGGGGDVIDTVPLTMGVVF